MDDLALARVVHVLAIIFWIGGVSFVTLVLMPALRAIEPPEACLGRFQQFEHRFAWQARVWVLLTGASGLWLVARGGMWSRFADGHFWWMHLMVVLWGLFALMLFVIEPLGLHRRLAVSNKPAAGFVRMLRLHQALLVIGVITILGAVGGAHGLF